MLFDLRDILRSVRRDLPYTSAVVLTLALTIGGTTAVFSIVNGVLLKPLAYRESHRLVAIHETWREVARQSPTIEVNERHAEYWREHAKSFDGLAQFAVVPANVTIGGHASQITIARTNGSLFDVLRVAPFLGRALSREEDRPGAADVAVVSDRFWRERLAGDPAAIGGSIVLDGHPATIVGVLTPDFRLPAGGQISDKVEAFLPLHGSSDWIGMPGWYGDHNNDAIARLRAGVTLEEAQAELGVLQRQVSALATQDAHEPVTLGAVLTPLADDVVGRSRQGLLVLLGSVGAVLLIACTNLANLSLTRTMGRMKDAAVRSALGAGRTRMVLRSLLEQLLLAAAGGALGLLVASVGLTIFVRTAGVELPRVEDVTLDGHVLLFALCISVFCGVVVAMLPAWRIAGMDLERVLRASSAAIATDRGGLRIRSTLLAMQIALSVILLAVTALLTVSFVRLLSVDRGFNTERVLTLDVSLPADRYRTDGLRRDIYDRILEAVATLPGVQCTTITSKRPLSGQGQVNFVAPEGSTAPRELQPSANFRFVGPEFARTLGIPLIRGRAFEIGERDAIRPLPALISSSLAERLWPNRDPIGRRFSRTIPGEQLFEVVGVLTDARLTALDRTPPYMVYVPYWWRSHPTGSLLVRSDGDPVAITSAIERAVQSLDPDIAIGETISLDSLVARSLAGRRYQTRLFVVFGAVALFIAIVGVYAVTAYAVSRRRREMNIRTALGARRGQVIRMVLIQSGEGIAAGLVIGVAGALAAGGVVASLLFGVQPRDPVVIAGIAGLVGLTAIAAASLAARAGLKLDPAAALREE